MKPFYETAWRARLFELYYVNGNSLVDAIGIWKKEIPELTDREVSKKAAYDVMWRYRKSQEKLIRKRLVELVEDEFMKISAASAQLKREFPWFKDSIPEIVAEARKTIKESQKATKPKNIKKERPKGAQNKAVTRKITVRKNDTVIEAEVTVDEFNTLLMGVFNG